MYVEVGWFARVCKQTALLEITQRQIQPKPNVNSVGRLNCTSFWRQLSGNFHADLATVPQLE